MKSRGFTLIELLVVIAIIGLLSTLALISVNSARQSAHIVVATQQQRMMMTAVEMYFNDMGFYPPDVGRGWDPGFVRPMPWNPDVEDGEISPSSSPGTDCRNCPEDWEDRIQQNWSGPYLTTWPKKTPWNGEYDYNYWPSGGFRMGCSSSPGIYIGVEGYYGDVSGLIPSSTEQTMVDKGYDGDRCVNGESQMLLEGL